MHILMFTNYPPSAISKGNFVNEGWIDGIQKELLKREGIKLSVMYPQKQYENTQADIISEHFSAYGYFFNEKFSIEKQEKTVKEIENFIIKNKIDVVQIMGTEFAHSLMCFKACKNVGLEERTLVTLQGMISFCAKHYFFGVPNIYKLGLSIPEIYFRQSLKKQMLDYKKRGEYEEKLISECRHILGRTEWDRKCTKLINPEVKYHYAGEILRKEFYNADMWDINNVEKYSIFISQATYPIKGLQHILLALPEIINRFPAVKIYIAGNCPINSVKWKRNSYANYLQSLINKGNLKNHIVFLGRLTAPEMVKRHLKSHIFLSPSNIENSSNSIAEAMILGVPTVASNVGGTYNMISHGNDGFTYSLTEPYMMVSHICELFSNSELCEEISVKARKTALERHDPQKIVNSLYDLYNEVKEN